MKKLYTLLAAMMLFSWPAARTQPQEFQTEAKH